MVHPDETSSQEEGERSGRGIGDGSPARASRPRPRPGSQVSFRLPAQDREDDERRSAAKYVQGRVGLLRAPTALAAKVRGGRRDGVIVINIADGGSLEFYQEAGKHRRSLLNSAKEATEVTITSDQSIFTRGLLDKSRRDSVRSLDLDDQMRAKIAKVMVSTQTEHFVAPAEMPHLAIPAGVPWQLKSVSSKLKQCLFQIVVPPAAEGGPDRRVRILTSQEKAARTRRVTIELRGEIVTFAAALRPGFDGDDDGADAPSAAAPGPVIMSMGKDHTQVFTFRCGNPRELAVYAEAAATLGRACAGNKYRSLTNKASRIRDAEGMEIAAQSASFNREGLMKRRVSSIGQQEFRVQPLHVYPNTWMTKKELAEDLVRESSHFHDLRTGCPEEIGSARIELLQCMGVPRMDRVSLSDVYAYIICGSAAFVTDVINDNLNPGWLPKTRRACILPLRQAHAQVFFGFFDYDGEKEKDDFIGRVVLDVPQLRACHVYDITLPLRQTARIYNRKKLGCARLRIQVSWRHGERSALLSYIPRSPADISKLRRRLKKAPPAPETLVWCPDAKSFQNVVRTVYGKDIPGKFNPSVADAVSRELTMIIRVVEYNIKRISRDIIRWNNPVLSGYIFTAWMYFVCHNSLRLVPSFVCSLILVFMIRNHLKYNLHSVIGSFYGRRSIVSMCYTLLFNPEDSNPRVLQVERASQTCDRLLSKIFGVSTDHSKSWKEEDNSEYPFSIGSYHPKVSADEAAAARVWDAAQDLSSSSMPESQSCDQDGEEWSSEEGEEEEEGLLQNCNHIVKMGISNTKHVISEHTAPINPSRGISTVKTSISNTKHAISEHAAPRIRKRQSWEDEDPPNESDLTKRTSAVKTSISNTKHPIIKRRQTAADAIPPNISILASARSNIPKWKSTESILSKNGDDATVLAGSTCLMPTNFGAKIVIPDQNVTAKKAKKETSMLQDIKNIHRNVSRANLHLFDDRVFWVEDREDAHKLLTMNSKNPIRKMLNPLAGGVMKIFDIQISFFRAVFNMCMWKDPMLSFWFSLFIFCLMTVFLIFPWRLFFFGFGVLGLGPQNYFLADLYYAKHAARYKTNSTCQSTAELPSPPKRTPADEVSESTLLFRDNIQMKADDKRRGVIVPGGDCVFRFNRFYDWPPDPSMSTIKQQK